MKKILIIAGLLVVQFVSAQEQIAINMETLLEVGGTNNLIIQSYQLNQELAIAKFDKTKEWWLPNIYVGAQTHQLNGAAMNTNGKFSLDVDRENLWAGLGLDANWNFSDGIFKTKAAKHRKNAAFYENQANKNKTLLNLIETYYDFLTAQLQFKAYQQLVNQATSVTNQINIQVEAGLRYQSEFLLSKSNLNHLKVEMLNAKRSYITNAASLVNKLNLNNNTTIVSVDTVLIPITLSFTIEGLKRAEYHAAQESIKAMHSEKKTTTWGLLFPELNVNAYKASVGTISGNVSPVFPSQYPSPEQLYPTSGLSASLKWKIPLGNLIYRGDLKQYSTKIHLAQNKLNQVNAMINEDISINQNALTILKEQLSLTAEANQLANDALEQSIQRQQNGTAKPFEILQAQEIYIKAKLDYLQTVSSYNKTQYRLYVANGGNL